MGKLRPPEVVVEEGWGRSYEPKVTQLAGCRAGTQIHASRSELLIRSLSTRFLQERLDETSWRGKPRGRGAGEVTLLPPPYSPVHSHVRAGGLTLLHGRPILWNWHTQNGTRTPFPPNRHPRRPLPCQGPVTESHLSAWEAGSALHGEECPPSLDVCLCVPSLLWPHELQPARLLCPWESPGRNTGVGCHALLQGIFPA